MKLIYSSEAAAHGGYSLATMKDGKTISYTNMVSDQFDVPDCKIEYMWKDKIQVFDGLDSDIVSTACQITGSIYHNSLKDYLPKKSVSKIGFKK